jgi:hypothetical protein
VLTAVLTLAGGLVLLRFQSASKAAEERRAARRQWHEEAVDVAVDVGNLILDAGILALNLPVRGRDGDLMNHFDRWTELQEVWATTLRRRVQRIARGHPDSGMRAQAKLMILMISFRSLTQSSCCRYDPMSTVFMEQTRNRPNTLHLHSGEHSRYMQQQGQS